MTALPCTGRTARRPRPLSPGLLIGLAIAVGVALLLLANAHLVYVAVSSQPECVAHLKAGEAAPGPGQFSAAKPSC